MSQTLAVSIFRPTGDPIACIEIVHGMAEHRKRYDDFARYLQRRGYAVVTYDLPGHGETADSSTLGYFGDNYGWQRMVNSAYETAKECKRLFPDIPLVLMGHSMGTIIARCFLQKYADEIDGLILSGAPCYQSAVEAGVGLAKGIRAIKGKKGYSKLLDQMVTGNFNKVIDNPRTPVDWLSYNEKNVDQYIADPLCGFSFTIQGYIDEMEGIRRMHDVSMYKGAHADLPILMFAGAEDPCIGKDEGWADSQKTLIDAGYHTIETKLYPHMRHETLNEKYNLAVYEDVVHWLKKHIG